MTSSQTHVGQWAHGGAPPADLPGLTLEGREEEAKASGQPWGLWPDAWGLGWRRNQAEKHFGSSNGSELYGHHGATGAMMWCDPTSGVSCAVLTSQPSLCYSDEFNTISDLVLSGSR